MTFREVQRPSEGPLLAVLVGLLIVGVFAWFGAGRHLLADQPPLPVWDEEPWSKGTTVVLWVVFGVLLPSTFFMVRMVTEVRDGMLAVGLRPMRTAHYELRAMRQVQVVTLTADEVKQSFRARGLAHRAGGTTGVVISLDDRRNVFVESHRPEELSAALYRSR